MSVCEKTIYNSERKAAYWYYNLNYNQIAIHNPVVSFDFKVAVERVKQGKI